MKIGLHIMRNQIFLHSIFRLDLRVLKLPFINARDNISRKGSSPNFAFNAFRPVHLRIYIKIKIYIKFLFSHFLWCPKRFYEGL